MDAPGRLSTLRKLLASAFFLDAGFFLLVAAVPYKVLSLGGGALELGVTPTVSSVFYITLTHLAGRGSDRWGRYRMARYGALAMILFGALAYAAPHWARLLLVMPLLGLGAALYWPAIQAGVGDLSRGPRELERHTGRFNLAWSLGKSLGFLAAGLLLARYDFHATFLTAIGLIALSIFGLPRREVEDAEEPAEEPSAAEITDARRQAFRRMAWMANALAFGAGAILTNFLPQIFEQRGWPESRFGLLLGLLYTLQTLVFLLLSGKVRFTYSLRRLLAPQILAAGALLAMPLLPGYWPLLALMPLLGLSFGVCYSASIYYSLDTDSGRGRNAGVHESLIGTGILLFPLLGGLLARLSGDTLLTLYMAGGVMLAGVIVQWIWWRRSA